MLMLDPNSMLEIAFLIKIKWKIWLDVIAVYILCISAHILQNINVGDNNVLVDCSTQKNITSYVHIEKTSTFTPMRRYIMEVKL